MSASGPLVLLSLRGRAQLFLSDPHTYESLKKYFILAVSTDRNIMWHFIRTFTLSKYLIAGIYNINMGESSKFQKS